MDRVHFSQSIFDIYVVKVGSAMSGAYGDRSLKETPTWAVALVSAVFVIISILIEHGIHSLGKVQFFLGVFYSPVLISSL